MPLSFLTGLAATLPPNGGHMQPILANDATTFATSFARLFNREFMRNAEGVGSFSTLASDFAPFLYTQGGKAPFPLERRW